MITDTIVVDVSRDWLFACDVQQRFMQGRNPAIDTLDYSARCRQVHELGGDCYDFTPLEEKRLALTIGDASGHGLAAALMIANVQSSLRTAASILGEDVAAMLDAVNRQVHASSLANQYATLFHGIFDGSTRMLRYVNAGHISPMIIRPDSSIIFLETCGAPIGMFSGSVYEERAVQLNPGDMVLACTDGVIEAVNPSGEEWGVEGLRRAALEVGAKCADDVVQMIFSWMDEFSRGRQTDDATVVVLQVH